jgi:hypothetical protein
MAYWLAWGNLARSETLRTRRSSLRGTWEVSPAPGMYADEKSDEAVVLTKRPNKGRKLPAEDVEGRASPKGNSRQAAVVRTLSRATTSIRLAAVRRIACGLKPHAGRRSTRGRRSYAGAAGGVIPFRCKPTTKA